MRGEGVRPYGRKTGIQGGCPRRQTTRADVGVIGGADGPTAVFITGAHSALPALAAACTALAAVLLFLLLHRRKK